MRKCLTMLKLLAKSALRPVVFKVEASFSNKKKEKKSQLDLENSILKTTETGTLRIQI